NLQRLHLLVAQGGLRRLAVLHRDTDVADHAVRLQPRQRLPERRLRQVVRGWVMELVEVDRFAAQPFAARFRGAGQVLRTEFATNRALAEDQPALGGDEGVLTPALDRAADELLAAAVAVHVRRVDEVGAAGHRGTNQIDRGVLVRCQTVGGAQAPATKADLAHEHAGFAKLAVVHLRLPAGPRLCICRRQPARADPRDRAMPAPAPASVRRTLVRSVHDDCDALSLPGVGHVIDRAAAAAAQGAEQVVHLQWQAGMAEGEVAGSEAQAGVDHAVRDRDVGPHAPRARVGHAHAEPARQAAAAAFKTVALTLV